MTVIENAEYAEMMARMLCAWGRRVASGDTYDLAELLAFRAEVDQVVHGAITRARRRDPEGWSWTNIADSAGTSRQAAQQRWGKLLGGGRSRA
jgi:hypothetical protein